MRRVAVLTHPVERTHRLILFASAGDVYLFLSESPEDEGSFADLWFASVEDAEHTALADFGVKASDWRECPDPLPGCQHDWIAPVRVPGREEGSPRSGTLERLEEGVWRPFTRAPRK